MAAAQQQHAASPSNALPCSTCKYDLRASLTGAHPRVIPCPECGNFVSRSEIENLAANRARRARNLATVIIPPVAIAIGFLILMMGPAQGVPASGRAAPRVLVWDIAYAFLAFGGLWVLGLVMPSARMRSRIAMAIIGVILLSIVAASPQSGHALTETGLALTATWIMGWFIYEGVKRKKSRAARTT